MITLKVLCIVVLCFVKKYNANKYIKEELGLVCNGEVIPHLPILLTTLLYLTHIPLYVIPPHCHVLSMIYFLPYVSHEGICKG